MATIVKVIIACLLLTACATVHDPTTPESAKALIPSYPLKDYLLQPGDQIDVKFFNNPELNELLVTIRPDGRISLQMAPEVMVAGLTPAQLTEQLTKIYEKELVNPGIAVIVRSFTSQRVFVDGEVFRPGMVNLAGTMTALQSIAQAGGCKEPADLSQVIIIRRTPEGKIVNIVANLKDAVYGVDREQDVVLAPYDIVYVPRSAVSNVNLWVDQYIRRNIPIPFGFNIPIE